MLYCMKCGREVKNNQVFCSQCLSVMKQYPVKQDVRVQLPHRELPSEKKAPVRKKPLSPEEQIGRLRSAVKRLSVALACILLLLVFTVSLLFQDYNSKSPDNTIGKNYNTVNTGAGSGTD